MYRIDLCDKFFHGILTPGYINSEIKDELGIKKIESILSSNKLYCINSFLENNFNPDFISFCFSNFNNDKSELCLSVYPEIGQYSHCSDEFKRDAFSTFTANTFYLILDKKLLSDYSIRKGEFANEYYLTGNISVNKYLLGIGNAGLDISHNLKLAYYYFKYYNKEISFNVYK